MNNKSLFKRLNYLCLLRQRIQFVKNIAILEQKYWCSVLTLKYMALRIKNRRLNYFTLKVIQEVEIQV